ncbi:GNAT family N-acetyltransferase [candidate division KSB1 bacterium]
MLKGFPKDFQLKNGETAVIRPIDKRDKEKLHEFFIELPLRDRMFLKEDVTSEEVINRWFKDVNFARVIPLIVLVKDRIIADGTLHIDEFGWARHVGEIRLVVAKDFRKFGVATHLLRELYILAMKMKLEKLVGKMMAQQKRAVTLFTDLGFKREATLKGHVKDRNGRNHDLIIMSHKVDAHWNELENMITGYHDDFSGDFSGM